MADKIDISIVIPTFNEEKNVRLLYNELRPVLDKLNKKYEIIYVDDGSTDRTYDELVSMNNADKIVKVIQFRKNFGQTAAMDCGFKSAQGKVIIVMDADLQNDPNDIPRLLEKMDEGYDVVSGWRYNRRDPFSKKVFSKVANIIRRNLTGEKIHDSGCSLKAYKKECFDDLDLYGEMHRFIPALLMWKGFKIGEIKVNHRKRKHGKTKYGIKRLLKGFLDILVVKFWMQYSGRPIHLFGGLGILSFFFGFLIGIYLTILKLFFSQPLSNRPLLLLSMLLVILGVQLFMFGVLADIMIKNYFSGNGKSIYSIKNKV